MIRAWTSRPVYNSGLRVLLAENTFSNLLVLLKNLPEFELKEGVGFLSSKFVTIHASCDKGGYVPGENIEVKLRFDNDSDKDISAIKVILEQVEVFFSLFLLIVDEYELDILQC